MRIDQPVEVISGFQMMRRRAVKPRRRRWIVGPGMVRAGVIDDVIDEHLHAQPVSVGHQRLVFRHGSHVVVEGVEVDDVVAVVVGVGVLPDRSEPQRVHAEIVEISQMLANAAQIAAVIRHGIAAVIFRNLGTSATSEPAPFEPAGRLLLGRSLLGLSFEGSPSAKRSGMIR